MAGYGGIRQTGWRWLPNSANITISNSSISATVPKWVDHRCTPNNQVGAERSSLVRIAPRRQPCSRIHLHQSGRVPRFPGILGLHTRHRHVNTPEDATNHHVDSKFRVVARAMSSQAPHSPPHNFFEALVAPSTSRVETGLPWGGFRQARWNCSDPPSARHATSSRFGRAVPSLRPQRCDWFIL